MWQSALPPTLCAIGICIIYLQFTAAHRVSAVAQDSFGVLSMGSLRNDGYLRLALHSPSQLDLGYWPAIIQTAIGKLYVLSLFYMLWVFASIHVVLTVSNVETSNAQTLVGTPRPVEQSTAFISTLTVPTGVLNAPTLDAPEDITCSEIAAGRGPSRTVVFAV